MTIQPYVRGFRCLCGQFHTEIGWGDYVVWQCSNCNRKWRIHKKGAQLVGDLDKDLFNKEMIEIRQRVYNRLLTEGLFEQNKEGEWTMKITKEMLVTLATAMSTGIPLNPAIDTEQDEKALRADILEASELLTDKDKKKFDKDVLRVLNVLLNTASKKQEEVMKEKQGKVQGKGVAKDEGKKAKAKGEGKAKKEKTPKAVDTRKIKILAKENPKREGTKAFKLFAKYTNGMTVADAVKAGVKARIVRNDAKKGLIEIK